MRDHWCLVDREAWGIDVWTNWRSWALPLNVTFLGLLRADWEVVVRVLFVEFWVASNKESLRIVRGVHNSGERL